MKGKVLHFSMETHFGTICGDDGKQYNVQASEWKEQKALVPGMRVDFDIIDGVAANVYASLEELKADNKNASNTKSRKTALLLAFLLGGLGAHKFYTGSWGFGLLYLLLSFSTTANFLLTSTSALYFLVGLSSLPAILSVVEFVRYLILSNQEFADKAQALRGKPFGFIW